MTVNSVKFVSPPDGFWGMMLPNGSFNGMVGQVNRSEVDMSGTPVFMTDLRTTAVDFSEPLFFDEHRIYYKTPSVEPNIAGFLMPFTAEVWLSITAAVIGIIFVMFVLFFLYDSAYDMWGRHELQNIKPSAEREPGWRAFYFVAGNLLGQATPWDPNPVAVIRIMSLLWLWVALVISTVYKSNLQSMIIIPKINIPFDNIDQLAAQNKYGILMAAGGMLHQMATEAQPNTTLGRLHKRIEATKDMDNAMQRLVAGTDVAIGNTIHGAMAIHQSYLMTKSCPLTVSKEGFLTIRMGFVFQKRSKLKKIFDKAITALRESGIIDFMLRQKLTKAELCKVTKSRPSSDIRPLELWDIAGIMTIYLAGIAFSLISFAVEIFLERKRFNAIAKNFLAADSRRNIHHLSDVESVKKAVTTLSPG